MTGQTRLVPKDEPIVYAVLPLVAVPHGPKHARHFPVTPPSFSHSPPRRDACLANPTAHPHGNLGIVARAVNTVRLARRDIRYTIRRSLAKKYSHNGCSFPVCLDLRAPSPKLRLIMRQIRRPPTGAEAHRTPPPTFRLWTLCCIQWNDSRKNWHVRPRSASHPARATGC